MELSCPKKPNKNFFKFLAHTISHQVLSIQPLPREADNFPRGGKNFNHVPLFT